MSYNYAKDITDTILGPKPTHYLPNHSVQTRTQAPTCNNGSLYILWFEVDLQISNHRKKCKQTFVEGIFSNKVLPKVDIQAVGPPFLGEFPAWDSLQICTHVRGYKEGVRVGLISNVWFSLIPYTSSMNFWCQLLPTWNEEILEAGTFFLVDPICWPWKSYYSCQRDRQDRGTDREREIENLFTRSSSPKVNTTWKFVYVHHHLSHTHTHTRRAVITQDWEVDTKSFQAPFLFPYTLSVSQLTITSDRHTRE